MNDQLNDQFNEEALQDAAESSAKAASVEKLIPILDRHDESLGTVRIYIGQHWEYLAGFENDDCDFKIRQLLKEFLKVFVEEKRKEAKGYLVRALTGTV